MDTLWVYGDFDWLDEPRLIGRLTHESLRGSDSYGFAFDESWLRDYGGLFLSADLSPFPGMQYTREGRDLFGCFADSLPDRWGRTLLQRREQLRARDEDRPPRRLSSFDYLVGIDDALRTGALRFRETLDGPFLNSDPKRRVPPLTDIRTLEDASRELEQSEAEDRLPEHRWLEQLVRPGSSLGGARPKASVRDMDGTLYMAKFPSRSDDYDVGLWEHFAHLLARSAGVTVAKTGVIRTGSRYHTLLSRRFDREEDGRRIHFASSMTLLGLTDGDGASTGHGYPDIVDFIVRYGSDVESDLRELYRRVAFSICIGNSDDHFRNHGFLLSPKGWRLSPAYDLNPSSQLYQSLLINDYSGDADLPLLLDSSEEYLLERSVAAQIIDEVRKAVRSWRRLATRLEIPSREQALFADRLDRWSR